MPSLQRRLYRFAAAVLAPVLVGALAGGLIMMASATRSHQLTKETVGEAAVTLALCEGLEAARVAGSAYMEEREPDDLDEFEAAAGRVERALATPAFDSAGERNEVRAIRAEWRAAVHQLRANPMMVESFGDDEVDAEDVFEDHVNDAMHGAEQLVALSTTETREDLAEVERLNRKQGVIALAALLVAFGIAAFLARRVNVATVRPIRRLTRAAQALADGRRDDPVAIASSAELREMEDAFNRMAGALGQQQEQLQRQAFTDALTEIPNRALFEDRVRQALERSLGSGRRAAVLMIDVDDFKLVNDALGHASGDELIALVARRLSAAARPSDTVARFGGDEFAVLLDGVGGLDDALSAAERFRRLFDAPFTISGSDVVVSASIGIALSGTSHAADELLQRADVAMYRVKEQGKDGTAIFDPVMEERAVERLDTLNALRKAVDRGELVAHYQPITELATGRIVAAEALLRWERPGHGLVPPMDFIPLAEETGLIGELGAWILREACSRAREWRSDGAHAVTVAVNVSARQLLDADFEQVVRDVLIETGLEPEALTLEVTESSVMTDPEAAISKLNRLVETGVRVTLDDFGEGHSSLGYIRRLPIEGLKIARPFVRELGDPQSDSRLVRGIIELAHSLGLELVAEGIEEPEQHDALRALGCRLGQGFLFARPLEAPALRALLRERLPVG